MVIESLTLPGHCNPSRTFVSYTLLISRKAKIMGEIIRLVVDLNIDQVSLKISLMAVSERQMSGKGCSVREGLRTLLSGWAHPNVPSKVFSRRSVCRSAKFFASIRVSFYILES